MEAHEESTKQVELEELDVEQFAKQHGEREKPCARFYIIRIDREKKRVPEPCLTGKQILALVDKAPETHKLFQKFCGGKTEPIEPDEKVSFVRPGIERFQTIPKDTTEGAVGA